MSIQLVRHREYILSTVACSRRWAPIFWPQHVPRLEPYRDTGQLKVYIRKLYTKIQFFPHRENFVSLGETTSLVCLHMNAYKLY